MQNKKLGDQYCQNLKSSILINLYIKTPLNFFRKYQTTKHPIIFRSKAKIQQENPFYKSSNRKFLNDLKCITRNVFRLITILTVRFHGIVI